MKMTLPKPVSNEFFLWLCGLVLAWTAATSFQRDMKKMGKEGFLLSRELPGRTSVAFLATVVISVIVTVVIPVTWLKTCLAAATLK